MKPHTALTIRQVSILTAAGMILTFLLLSVLLFFLTKIPLLLAAGLLFTAAAAVWGLLFLLLVKRQLDDFSAQLCGMLDHMMDASLRSNSSDSAGFSDFMSGSAFPEQETMLSKILHRTVRLYEMLHENYISLSRQKEDLQSSISDISHQTRTIFSSLKLISETLLHKSITEEKRREFFRLQKSQTEKLEFYIHALLKISRLENDIIVLQKETCPLYETLILSVNSALTALEQKEIRFSMHCPQNLCFPHDRRWTSEALYNLLDNAVKYTPAKGKVSVSVEEWEHFVRITVADSGRGIPEPEQAAIFQRFYREEEVHNMDGLGIGLYLTREIISRQGGYIQIASAPGQGATFHVFLPLY